VFIDVISLPFSFCVYVLTNIDNDGFRQIVKKNENKIVLAWYLPVQGIVALP